MCTKQQAWCILHCIAFQERIAVLFSCAAYFWRPYLRFLHTKYTRSFKGAMQPHMKRSLFMKIPQTFDRVRFSDVVNLLILVSSLKFNSFYWSLNSNRRSLSTTVSSVGWQKYVIPWLCASYWPAIAIKCSLNMNSCINNYITVLWYLILMYWNHILNAVLAIN